MGTPCHQGPDAAWPVFVDPRSTAMLNTWVADVRFVLDRLEALNERDPNGLLTGRLDLTRVGYVGRLGGSVVFGFVFGLRLFSFFLLGLRLGLGLRLSVAGG